LSLFIFAPIHFKDGLKIEYILKFIYYQMNEEMSTFYFQVLFCYNQGGKITKRYFWEE